MITVEVKIIRGEGDSKTYLLKESGDSKKGTFKTFSPVAENADLPSFGKLYVKANRDKAKADKATVKVDKAKKS